MGQETNKLTDKQTNRWISPPRKPDNNDDDNNNYYYNSNNNNSKQCKPQVRPTRYALPASNLILTV